MVDNVEGSIKPGDLAWNKSFEIGVGTLKSKSWPNAKSIFSISDSRISAWLVYSVSLKHGLVVVVVDDVLWNLFLGFVVGKFRSDQQKLRI